MLTVKRWVAVCAALFLSVACALPGSAAEFLLLRLNGNLVKWGNPTLGRGAVITWALLDKASRFPDALNCRSMVPFTPRLASGSTDAGMAVAELRRAFDTWSAAADIRFRMIDDAEKADIVIGAQAIPTGRAYSSVAYGSPGDAPAGRVAAKALSPSARQAGTEPAAAGSRSVKSIRQSLICLNPAQAWKVGFDGNLAVYDLYFTFLHEIGHTIGLDHPGASGEVMGFRYDEKVRTLQDGDVAAVRRLYGLPRSASRQ
jgi:Matrixin